VSQLQSPIPIYALVDTGASCTCVDPTVLDGLALTPTGSVSVNTPSTGTTPHESYQYDVALVIPAPNGTPLVFQTIPVVAASLLAAQGFHALIGRDILSRCFFAYNGELGFFTLAY
jgi:predicted aspartyl protease